MARPPTAGQPIFPQQPGPTAVRSSAGPEGSPVSDLKISDPVFTLTLARGVEKGGLFELLDAALAGELADLPAMRAHQRAAVVTVLAVIAHTLRRHGGASLAEEWNRQIGKSALRIAAPPDEPAFLQPPTGEPTKRQSIESLDCLLPRVQHEVKETFSGSVEEWLFALMGGQGRPNAKARAAALTTYQIRQYQLTRRAAGAATGTINRETSALHRMCTLAVHWGWLDTVPGFPDRLRENPPRQGFFEHPEYRAVRAHLPAPWQDILDLAYYSGWRKNEILGLWVANS